MATSPDVQGALKALDKKFHELHITFGHATRIFCYDHLHDTRSDYSQSCGDAFDEWCANNAALSRHFSELTEQRTLPSAFRAFFDFYIEMVAVGTRRIFTELVVIGREHEPDGVAWAKAQARRLIQRYRRLVANWVREACDRPVIDPWLAPAFLTMKPAGHDRYDPNQAWERMDAASSLQLLEALAGEYGHRLENYIEDAAGDAYREAAKRPRPTGKTIETKVEGTSGKGPAQESEDEEAKAEAKARRILIEKLAKGECEPTYTQEEAALMFGVDVRTIYNWLEKGIARGGLQRIGTAATGESVLRKYKLLRKRKKLPDPQLLSRRSTA